MSGQAKFGFHENIFSFIKGSIEVHGVCVCAVWNRFLQCKGENNKDH